MKILLIVIMIIYALTAIFIAQYMYTTVVTSFKMDKGICTKKIITTFKIQAALSGMFFPVSLTVLSATLLAKKRLGTPARAAGGRTKGDRG